MGCSRHPECDLLDRTGTRQGPRVNVGWIAMHHPQTGNLLQGGLDSPVLPSDSPAPPLLGREAWGGYLSLPIEQGLRDKRYWELGKPKHEVDRP